MSSDAPVTSQMPDSHADNPYAQAASAPNPYAANPYPQGDYAPQAATTGTSGRVFSVVGAVFGVLAILFLPILFGTAGIALGFVGHSKGDRPFGLIVGFGSIVTTVVGMALGVIVAQHM